MALFFLANSCLARSNSQLNQKRQLLMQLTTTQKDFRRADQKLVQSISNVFDLFKSYLNRKVKEGLKTDLLPVDKEGNKRLSNYLASKRVLNPYSNLLKESDPTINVRVELKPSLSKTDLPGLRKKFPTSKKEKPGTIVVIHNGYDLALFYGTGIDGLPVKAPGSKESKLLSIQLKM